MKMRSLIAILGVGLFIVESSRGDQHASLPPIPLADASGITITDESGGCVERIIADSKQTHEIPIRGGLFRLSLVDSQIQIERNIGQHSIIVKFPYRGLKVPEFFEPPTMIEAASRFVVTQGFALDSYSTRGSATYNLDLEKEAGQRGTFEAVTLSPRGTGIVAVYNPESTTESPRILFLNGHLRRARKDLILDERYAGAKLTRFYSDPVNSQMYAGVWGPGRYPSLICLSQDGILLWETPLGTFEDRESLIGREVLPASFGDGHVMAMVPRPRSNGSLAYYVFVLGIDGKSKPLKQKTPPVDPIEAANDDAGAPH